MRLLFALTVAALSGAVSPSNDLEFRKTPGMPAMFPESPISLEANFAFNAEDFSVIDNTENRYLIEKPKTADGAWKLGLIYDGLSAAVAPDEFPYKRHEQVAEKWIERFPSSPTAHIVLASGYVAHAFFFRGTKMADNVSPSVWPKFREYIEKAEVVLENCKNICSVDPEWYVAMLNVANLQGWDKEKFAQLFEEGVGKFPDYQRIYYEGATYYSPLWHGSAEDTDRFVQSAVSRTQSIEGTIFYARIYSYLVHSSGFRCGCWSIDWPRMLNAFKELNKRYPDPWNANEFAFQACVQGDKAIFKQQVKNVPEAPLNTAIWGSQALLNVCKGWADNELTPTGVAPFRSQTQ